jgi:hypothetical protein
MCNRYSIPQEERLKMVTARVYDLLGIDRTEAIDKAIRMYYENNYPVCQITKRVRDSLRSPLVNL